MARFCTEILCTGSPCTQFARKGQPWCRAHTDPDLRERNADTREVIAMIAGMDLFTVALTLCNTVYSLRTRLIPPLHAQVILDAAAARLEELTEELERLTEERARLTEEQEQAQFAQTAATTPNNSHGNNQLHVVL